MSRGRQYIQFEGYFSESVLGIFRIIRGFADLRDLAAVSVPYELSEHESEQNRVVGHQRELNLKHAQDIKKYFENSDNRFIPEVIIAVRYPYAIETIEEKIVGIKISGNNSFGIYRRFSGKNHRIQKVWIKSKEIQTIKEQKIFRRIDGNHRLALAENLRDDAAVPSKYIAPFCMVLLDATNNQADDYSESLIFHTINSTALKLESEHGLRLLLGQHPEYAMTPENEFLYSPVFYLTRLLNDRLQRLPSPARIRFGERPLTALWDTAENLIEMDHTISISIQSLTLFADNLFAGLTDILTRTVATNPSLCNTYSFLELSARVWRDCLAETHDEKVNFCVTQLDRIGKWLGSEGITELLNPLSAAEQLLKTFKAAQNKVPKKVFLARWYPSIAAPNDAYNKANLRLQQLRNVLADIHRNTDISLELIDMGTEEGGTFPIHNNMYEAIASSNIIICDLTGQRPNVYVEAGYALKHHEKNRLIFLFEPEHSADKVPFDLNTFKYVQISQAAEIPVKIAPEINAILAHAGAPIGV